MISLDFGLFWCGGKISYLRYLTFQTLRHFHPDSTIKLYISKKSNKGVHQWSGEKQDFENEDGIKDYLDDIKKLNVKVIEMDYFGSPNYCPIYQVDLARWWMLYNGLCGFYLDMDQIILKSFSTLPLDKDFIYSRFSNADRPMYSPTGVIGSVKHGKVAKVMMDMVPSNYSPQSYNSSGPFVFESVINKMNLLSDPDSFNTPYDYFYPINCSSGVSEIYSGKYLIPKDSYALHIYLGHPLSQKFNKIYTEGFAKDSNDTISKKIKELELL